MINKSISFTLTFFGLLLIPNAHAEKIDEFPSKPVNIIIPYGAGGAADIMARVLAEKLSSLWNQSVTVENKPGGNGVVGISSLLKSQNDGYTLGALPVADLAVNPHIYKTRTFDALIDLEPVVGVGAVPNVLAVANYSDINSTIKKLKENKETNSYSSPGVGSQAHLAAEFFNKQFNISATHIPYNSVPAALSALAGNHVSYMFAQWPSVKKLAEAGKVKVIGVASEERASVAPYIPTIKELTGHSVGNFYSWSALVAPKGTSKEVREKIAKDVNDILNLPTVVAKFESLGAQPIGGSPEDLAKLIIKESNSYKEIVENSNIKAE